MNIPIPGSKILLNKYWVINDYEKHINRVSTIKTSPGRFINFKSPALKRIIRPDKM